MLVYQNILCGVLGTGIWASDSRVVAQDVGYFCTLTCWSRNVKCRQD